MAGKLLNSGLVVRTLSGVMFAAVVIGAVLLSRWSFGGLLVVIGTGCLLEFYRIAAMSGAQPQRDYGVALGVVMIITAFTISMGLLSSIAMFAFLPLLAAVPAVELYRKKENPLFDCAATYMGLIYVALPLSLLCYIGLNSSGVQTVYRPWVILSYIFVVWANDVGAYLAGVAFGRRRLMERISPKKSWEGFFGGLLLGVAVASVAGHLMGFDWIIWAGLGFVVVVAGVLGDLVESMFKRAVDIKDSGSIMPGHGGFLDRFDALLLSLPFAFVYIIIFI